MSTNVVELVRSLTAAGVELVAKGDSILYRPRSAVRPEVVEALKQHKVEVLRYLEKPAIDSPEQLPVEWYLEWDERAAVMEYDGGLPRERAEALALADVLRRMRGRVG